MFYDEKCDCCEAEFTIMYSGKDYFERLKNVNYNDLDRSEKSGLNNLKLAIKKGNP